MIIGHQVAAVRAQRADAHRSDARHGSGGESSSGKRSAPCRPRHCGQAGIRDPRRKRPALADAACNSVLMDGAVALCDQCLIMPGRVLIAGSIWLNVYARTVRGCELGHIASQAQIRYSPQSTRAILQSMNQTELPLRRAMSEPSTTFP